MWLFSLYFENVTVSSRYCIYRHALDATRPSQENVWVMQTGPEQSPHKKKSHYLPEARQTARLSISYNM